MRPKRCSSTCTLVGTLQSSQRSSTSGQLAELTCEKLQPVSIVVLVRVIVL